tara:strand:- start:253 stop:993 length:741 start_codon:yes stop_codon:yes gene_type:complete
MKNNKKSFFEIFNAIKSYEMEREKNNNYLSYRFFYRPIGIFISPLFIKFNIKANTISFLRVLLFLIVFITSIFFSPENLKFIFLVTFLCVIFDFVDGIIARHNKTNSLFGKIIDQTSDFLFPTVYFVIPIFNNYENKSLLSFEIEVLIIYFVTTSYYLSSYFQVRITRFKENNSIKLTKENTESNKSKINFLQSIFSLLNQMNYLIIFIMFLLNVTQFSIIYLLTLRTLSMVSLAKKIIKSRELLN